MSDHWVDESGTPFKRDSAFNRRISNVRQRASNSKMPPARPLQPHDPRNGQQPPQGTGTTHLRLNALPPEFQAAQQRAAQNLSQRQYTSDHFAQPEYAHQQDPNQAQPQFSQQPQYLAGPEYGKPALAGDPGYAQPPHLAQQPYNDLLPPPSPEYRYQAAQQQQPQSNHHFTQAPDNGAPHVPQYSGQQNDPAALLSQYEFQHSPAPAPPQPPQQQQPYPYPPNAQSQQQTQPIAYAMQQLAAETAVREMSEDEIEQRATFDSQTPAFNLRYLVRMLRHELVRSQFFGRTVSILVVSMDSFEELETAASAVAVEKAIDAMAHAVMFSCRPIDLVGRYMMGRFLVVCPETSEQAASEFAEKVRKTCEQIAVTHQWQTQKMSASIGIACSSPQCNDLESLLAMADLGADMVAERGGNGVFVAK